MASFPLLLADADGWVQLVGIVILILGWLIQHLVGAVKQPPKAAPKPRNPVPPVPQPQRPRPAQAKNAPDIATEIEEFLRNAASRRQKRPAPAVRPTAEKPATPVTVRRLVTEPLERPVEAELIEDSKRHESVAEHVAKHLTTREFETRAEHMADDIERGDQQMQQHLKQVFSHQVGRLASTSGAPEAKTSQADSATPVKAPVDFAVLLANADSLRQAVIFNEVLRRPEERW